MAARSVVTSSLTTNRGAKVPIGTRGLLLLDSRISYQRSTPTPEPAVYRVVQHTTTTSAFVSLPEGCDTNAKAIHHNRAPQQCGVWLVPTVPGPRAPAAGFVKWGDGRESPAQSTSNWLELVNSTWSFQKVERAPGYLHTHIEPTKRRARPGRGRGCQSTSEGIKPVCADN